MQHSKAPQGWQNSQIALRAPRTWLVSSGTFVISWLLLAATLAFLPAVSPTLSTSLSSHMFLILVLVPLLCLFFSLLFALVTNRAHQVKLYRKALKKHLAISMENYYSPKSALAIQEHLAALMSGDSLQASQEHHLLILGGPGSGKTANLKHAVYQAVSLAQRKKYKLPVLIQMKYYNGFLRNLRVASPSPGMAPEETFLAYLLDDEHEQQPQAEKEPELVGLHHLRHYLSQLVEQGRIVFLCDGMNELENDALASIHAELLRLLQTTHNAVVMTCRELEYQEQELLQDLASKGTAIKTLPPLTEEDVAEIVKTYLQSQHTPGRVPLGDAGIEEAQEQIRRLSQSYRETSPFLLMMLLEALKTPEAQAGTISRGRLLRLSVDQRPLMHEPAARIFGDHPDAQHVKDFLSAVACTARRNGQRNAMQLVKDTKFTTSSQLQDFLNVWLSDNEVDVSKFTQANIGKFLRIALDAGLITISSNGVLSFIHELIAEYFAAEYLRFIYLRKDPEDQSFWHSIYESEVHAAGLWSEPVAIWAGLAEQPKEIARFLMTTVDRYCLQKGMSETETDLYHYHALALSLGCLGVRASDGLPDETLSYLKQSALVKEKHEQLAVIFKRCADEGGVGVYQALLPYIHLPGLLDVLLKIHELYRETEHNVILTILFEYLEKAAAIPAYADQTQALITLLGEIGRRGGETVRPRTRLLSATSRPPLLRAAAMNILELLRNPDDVPLLISYLHTADKEVIGSAISAVRSFGPAFTLALLEREETQLQDQAHAQTRLNLLRVLEGFLLEEHPQRPPIALPLMQRLIALIIRFLSACDKEPTWLLALELLNGHVQKSPEDASLVTVCLLDAIDSQDHTLAEHIQQLLKDNCLHVLGTIIDYWTTRKSREGAGERIIAVLGSVSDPAILAFLLQQLDEPETSMQHALSTALSLQQESTDPLLQSLLAPAATPHVIRVAGNALRQIGPGCIPAVCEHLLNIHVHAEATESGLKCLVDLLDEFKKNKSISAKTAGVMVRALVALFKWLVEDAQLHPQLAADMIPVMAGFRDQRIVSALLKMLARSDALLERMYDEAIKGLSQLGEYSINHLIEALNSPKETLLTKRVRQVLLEMVPFPHLRLLAALADTRSTIVQQVMGVFLARQQDVETIRFLIQHLLENSHDHPLFENIQQTLTQMQPESTVPYLVEVLGQPHWQVIKPLLRACPQPEIVLPLLVKDLADLQRYALVLEVLREEFDYPTVLPWLIPGLVNEHTRQDTRRVIETMARTYEGDLLPEIVRLFNPAIARPEPLSGPLPEVQSTLEELLTTDLAEVSLPALAQGLAEPPLREGCISSLVALAQSEQRQEGVLKTVVKALRHPTQRFGAHQTLVRCGQIAAQPVFDLVRGDDPDLVGEACTILAEMGEIAFPYIYQLAHDPQHPAQAEAIFHLIPVGTIAKGLLDCFASHERQQETMAFCLLAMGMHDEQSARPGNANLTSALLNQTLEQTNSEVGLRVLSTLLFFSHGKRAELAQHLVNTITQASKAPLGTEYLRALLLLGKEAADPLGLALHTPDVPEDARLEMIALLGMLAEEEQITAFVNTLASGAQGTASTNGTGNQHRARGLRALGGLLAGGIYHEKKLEEIRARLGASPKAQDRAAGDFFDVLLGKRLALEGDRLREMINKQQEEIDRLNQQLHQREEKLAPTSQRVK